MGVFDGQRAVWQFMYSAQAEGDPLAVCATLRDYAGASVWLVKCMDGGQWMSRYDGGARAIGSLADWQQTAQTARLAGAVAVPWVVAQVPEDALSHVALGPVLVVDLEPYPQFWQAPAADVGAYLQTLRDGGVSELYVSIDPRPSAMAALDVAAWAGLVDGLLPQLYWTDFQQPAMSCIPFLDSCLALNPNVYPVLPYNGLAGDMQAFWNAAQTLGSRGVSLWRLGSASADQLRAFRALAVTPDPCQALRQQLAAQQQTITSLQARITAAVTALGGQT